MEVCVACAFCRVGSVVVLMKREKRFDKLLQFPF